MRWARRLPRFGAWPYWECLRSAAVSGGADGAKPSRLRSGFKGRSSLRGRRIPSAPGCCFWAERCGAHRRPMRYQPSAARRGESFAPLILQQAYQNADHLRILTPVTSPGSGIPPPVPEQAAKQFSSQCTLTSRAPIVVHSHCCFFSFHS